MTKPWDEQIINAAARHVVSNVMIPPAPRRASKCPEEAAGRQCACQDAGITTGGATCDFVSAGLPGITP